MHKYKSFLTWYQSEDDLTPSWLWSICGRNGLHKHKLVCRYTAKQVRSSSSTSFISTHNWTMAPIILAITLLQCRTLTTLYCCGFIILGQVSQEIKSRKMSQSLKTLCPRMRIFANIPITCSVFLNEESTGQGIQHITVNPVRPQFFFFL